MPSQKHGPKIMTSFMVDDSKDFYNFFISLRTKLKQRLSKRYDLILLYKSVIVTQNLLSYD